MRDQIYDVEYFINKFEAIPDHEIGAVRLSAHCALWHCGLKNGEYVHTDESKALTILFGGDINDKSKGFPAVYTINDGGFAINERLGDTPKQRILNKLYQIRDGK